MGPACATTTAFHSRKIQHFLCVPSSLIFPFEALELQEECNKRELGNLQNWLITYYSNYVDAQKTATLDAEESNNHTNKFGVGEDSICIMI